MTKLLLIEDDDETAAEVSAYVQGHGYTVERAATGPQGLEMAAVADMNIPIVDRMLPGLDGLSVFSRLRQDRIRVPAIVLSALGAVDERVRGLRAGGDDYLVKPFALSELLARIEAVLRRPVVGAETVLRLGPLRLDMVSRTARRGSRVLDLLPREFSLLEFMMRRPGQTITRTMLFEEVWKYTFTPRSNLVDVHMGRLRRKLNGAGEEDLIANVRGIGFVLDPTF